MILRWILHPRSFWKCLIYRYFTDFVIKSFDKIAAIIWNDYDITFVHLHFQDNNSARPQCRVKFYLKLKHGLVHCHKASRIIHNLSIFTICFKIFCQKCREEMNKIIIFNVLLLLFFIYKHADLIVMSLIYIKLVYNNNNSKKIYINKQTNKIDIEFFPWIRHASDINGMVNPLVAIAIN